MRIVETIHGVNHWLYRHKVPLIPLIGKAALRVFFHVVLPPSAVLGRGVLIGYQGLGTVIHANARIGNRVTIGSNVTIGGRSGLADVPIIEDDVEIGTGARILGPIRIGRSARIGANAVVLTDVPPGATFAGVPARFINSRCLHAATDELSESGDA